MGQYDITIDVSLVSRHLALPGCVHIYLCFNIYAYLKKHPYSKNIMNPAYMNIKYKSVEHFHDEAEWF